MVLEDAVNCAVGPTRGAGLQLVVAALPVALGGVEGAPGGVRLLVFRASSRGLEAAAGLPWGAVGSRLTVGTGAPVLTGGAGAADSGEPSRLLSAVLKAGVWEQGSGAGLTAGASSAAQRQ